VRDDETRFEAVSYSVWRAAAAGGRSTLSNISCETGTISNIGCCYGDPQSEEGFGLSTSKQPKMIKSDRLPMRSVAHTCSQQVWRDFGNGCLLNSGKDAKILVAYLTTARR
jgi:hypothetical protein